jgi:membrane protein required for colicin V production
MNHFDVALLVIACVLVVVGMMKGLVRILIGIAALIAAFAVAARFHQPLADQLGWIEIQNGALMLLSWGLLFVGVILAGAIAGHVMRRVLKAAMLSWADRLGGAALGLVAAALIAALIVLPLVAYTPYGESLLTGSVLAPYVSAVADLAATLLPAELTLLYQRNMESLRQAWRDQWNSA